MAVKSRNAFSFWQAVRFLLRFIGLNGLVAVAVGSVLWFALNQEYIGMIVVLSGGSAVGLALLGEVSGLAGAVASHRGWAGVNVFLESPAPPRC